MRGMLVGLAGLMATERCAVANTVIIDFDHATVAAMTSPDQSIRGLRWSNFGIIDAAYVSGPHGLINGVVSTPNVAFNYDSNAAAIISGRPFGFMDAWFSAWGYDALTVQLAGYDALHTLLYSSSFSVDDLGPTLETFGWQGMTSLEISSRSTGGYAHFCIDDVRLSMNVSEPKSLILILLTFGFVACRYRRQAGSFQ